MRRATVLLILVLVTPSLGGCLDGGGSPASTTGTDSSSGEPGPSSPGENRTDARLSSRTVDWPFHTVVAASHPCPWKSSGYCAGAVTNGLEGRNTAEVHFEACGNTTTTVVIRAFWNTTEGLPADAELNVSDLAEESDAMNATAGESPLEVEVEIAPGPRYAAVVWPDGNPDVTLNQMGKIVLEGPVRVFDEPQGVHARCPG